jgi:hypothetical protein
VKNTTKKNLLLGLVIATHTPNVSTAHNENNDHQHAPHAHNTHGVSSSKKLPPTKKTIKLDVVKIEDKNEKKRVQIRLARTIDNKPISINDLKELHTQKIHLLIIDDSLEDYTHEHPIALNETGLYEFKWSQKKQGNYRIWADLFPLDTNAQEYVQADLVSGKEAKTEINRTTSLENTIEGYTFKLSFDTDNLLAGKPALGKVNITDAKGNPVKDLEPVMGAYAHFVGFSDDMRTVVHIHPMGEEPTKLSDRGGPELQFHIIPEKAGFIKLFAQVNIKGKEIFVPFGLNIK